MARSINIAAQKMATSTLWAITVASLLLVASVTVRADSSAPAAATGAAAPVTVLDGHQADVLCKHTGEKLIYCRIIVPGEAKAFVLSETTPSKLPGFTYFGAGLAAGECGLSIRAVQSRHGGSVTCYMGIDGDEVVQTAQLTVALPPQRPKLEIVSANAAGERRSVRNASFEIFEHVSVKCVSPNGRPAAQLAWFIDDKPLTGDNVGAAETIRSPPPKANQAGAGNQAAAVDLYTAVQTIQLQMRASDDNKTLTCRATQSGQTQEAHMKLKVGFRPQPQPPRAVDFAAGQTALINVTVAANPPPHTTWIVGNERIEQGSHQGRFAALDPIGIGNGVYNVTLAIVALQPEDAAVNYALTASNQYGQQEYLVQLSATPALGSGADAEGNASGKPFDMSSVLLALGTTALLLAILSLTIARVTGHCCFGRPGAALAEDVQEKV